MSAAAAAVDGGLHWVAAQRADELRVEQQTNRQQLTVSRSYLTVKAQ